jgi:hypothetical protein
MSLKRQRRSSASAFLFRANGNFMRVAHVLLINVCGSTSEMASVDQESLGDLSTLGFSGRSGAS